MNKITVGDEVYAILVLQKKAKKGTTWIGEPYEPLQGSIMKYEKGKVFRLHRHILNPRMIQRTQEALDRKSTRLNSSHIQKSRMPSSA